MMWWILIALFQQPQNQKNDAPDFDKNPFTSEADLAQGKRLYEGRCAGCHGPKGDGGKGTNLAQPVLPRAGEDRSLWLVIRYGIPDTEMPASLMAQREIWQVAAYVRGLGVVRGETAKGDPVRGERLVRGKGGCLACHAIGTDGGRLGPALSDIGTRRGPGHLRAKIADGQSDIPVNFRTVTAAGKDGKKLSGVRLNEDSYSIQFRDASDKLYSYWKKDLTSLKVERISPMPSYRGKLSDAEIGDVAAYLAGLRGVQ
jgi:putative heme-binding domain-containing protein